ncbi:ribosomal RNA processing protein 1 homolog A [Astatotilapia calliptera]|uniref:ribosomal RNA processing protein 1 homolog A n=1 Tax=Astatotilapia calliptera TaxID=8154 RepID=UPI000E40E536|nr:ribosomal RNA processing protein 1 homolog A-like [Astatotilapia calliptera]
MADQQAEVQLAQRLASNEKPVRTRAMKKLRKYVSLRSQKGEFSGEELLKLWKGLFYCLWMQDKPLLQEELSRKISTLIHSFTSTQQQLSYLRSFLQTMKREWTGIDRLRMDKFFQLVRFVFRQTFEVLRRRSWDSSAVSQFLELLTAQLLQSDAAAPSGLQLHVLDLYLTELAVMGAAELTADQNLTLIEPFCRTAARTKEVNCCGPGVHTTETSSYLQRLCSGKRLHSTDSSLATGYNNGCTNTSALKCEFTSSSITVHGSYTGRVRAHRGAESSSWVESNVIDMDRHMKPSAVMVGTSPAPSTLA